MLFRSNSLITIGITLASGLTSVAISTPAYSITLVDLSTFTSIGDVSSNNTVIKSGSLNTVDTGGGTGSLEQFLGINANNFATAIPENQRGSAIKSTLNNINAGDVFSFNWNFTSGDTDQAFVTINNVIQTLTGNSSYS